MKDRESICPDASVCYSCPARRVELDNHYCEPQVFDTRTSSGAIRTRPTFCPKVRAQQKAEESQKVQLELQRLFRDR